MVMISIVMKINMILRLCWFFESVPNTLCQSLGKGFALPPPIFEVPNDFFSYKIVMISDSVPKTCLNISWISFARQRETPPLFTPLFRSSNSSQMMIFNKKDDFRYQVCFYIKDIKWGLWFLQLYGGREGSLKNRNKEIKKKWK